MTSNILKYKKEIDKLYLTGIQLQMGMLDELGKLNKTVNKEILKSIKPISFKENYDRWYSESLAVIKQLLPDRLEDFKLLYKNPKRKEADYETYTISDYLISLRVTFGGINDRVNTDAAIPKYKQQLTILEATRNRFESSLFDIKQLVQADIFDTELETATELSKKGFLRASGAIAGVIIEKHLKQVLQNRNITSTKKNLTIGDLNNILKEHEIIDVPQWRQIQLMADIRNLCDHSKGREPQKDEISDLLIGANRIIKNIF
jgi:hypothetical protein